MARRRGAPQKGAYSRKRNQTQRNHEALVGHCLGPDGIPQELLHRVLRACGRHARRVCHHWLATYGPLTGGLHLSGPDNLARIGPRLAATRTLALSPAHHFIHANCEPHVGAATFAALPQTFTRLQRLDINATLFEDMQFPLAAFPPFAPHLTSLTLRYSPYEPPAPGPIVNALPALQSLSITAERAAPLQDALAPMSRLSNLRHLSFRSLYGRSRADETALAPDTLSVLATLPPTLTHLDLGLIPLSFHSGGLQHLPPSLRHLSLYSKSWRTVHQGAQLTDAHVEALVSALSQRQALTHLELSLEAPIAGPLQAFSQFSRLWNLRSLDICCNSSSHIARQHLTDIGNAVSALQSLTRLVLRTSWYCQWEAGELQALLAAPMLQQLQLSGAFAAPAALLTIGHLGHLRALELTPGVDLPCPPDSLASAILGLTALTRLRILPSRERLSIALLAGVSVLANLRHLHIGTDCNADSLLQLASASSTLTRLELDCTFSGAVAHLPALQCLPCSVRCLVLRGLQRFWNCRTVPKRATRGLARLVEEAAAHLLPLPGGVRVLSLHRMLPKAFPGNLCSLVEAAARAQDCVVVYRLPDEDALHGCNGYI